MKCHTASEETEDIEVEAWVWKNVLSVSELVSSVGTYLSGEYEANNASNL